MLKRTLLLHLDLTLTTVVLLPYENLKSEILEQCVVDTQLWPLQVDLILSDTHQLHAMIGVL